MKEAKNPIKVKHENKNIVISRPYSIRAAIPNTKEYKLLAEIKSVYSDYTIIIREIKKTPKESYKGLTYSYMEYYITTHENAEARMAEYNEIKPTACIRCARCINACPMSLMPTELEKAYHRKDINALLKLKVNLCINCGACTYVCPAGRKLAETHQLAKTILPRNK
jgi:ferredoxin